MKIIRVDSIPLQTPPNPTQPVRAGKVQAGQVRSGRPCSPGGRLPWAGWPGGLGWVGPCLSVFLHHRLPYAHFRLLSRARRTLVVVLGRLAIRVFSAPASPGPRFNGFPRLQRPQRAFPGSRQTRRTPTRALVSQVSRTDFIPIAVWLARVNKHNCSVSGVVRSFNLGAFFSSVGLFCLQALCSSLSLSLRTFWVVEGFAACYFDRGGGG